MLQKLKYLFIAVVFMVSVNYSWGQCLTFAKNSCKATMGSFVHDGNYNSTILSEGETAELFKTFFEGQTYRIAISKVDDLPPIHFKVVDKTGRILFDNKDFNFQMVWDFSIESTQMLVVQMQVLERPGSKDKISGCVSVLFGLERKAK